MKIFAKLLVGFGITCVSLLLVLLISLVGLEQLNTKLEQVYNTIDQKTKTEQVVQTFEESQKIQQQATFQLIVVFFGGLAFSLVIAVWQVRQITRSLKEVNQVAASIAGGNLNRVAVVKTKDEFAELAHTFNEMTHNLNEKFARILETSNKTAQSSSEIQSLSRETAAGAAKQASAITEISGFMEEVSRSVKGIDNQAEALASRAGETMRQIEQVAHNLSQSTQSITRLS